MLVVADPAIVNLAKKNVEKYDVVPLYYYAKKAKPASLSPESIWESLNWAFTTSNSIGVYSNNISKIWNETDWKNIDDEEVTRKLRLIKLLCCENNASIDAAKTLYLPTRPDSIDEEIKDAIHSRVPHFFIYAKNRNDDQVASTTNSLVNRLEGEIINPRLNFTLANLGTINPHYMMNNEQIEIDQEVIDVYTKLCRKFHFRLNITEDEDIGKMLHPLVMDIREQFMSTENEYSLTDICDMLIKHLYIDRQNVAKKEMFWQVFGDIVVKNLKRKIPEASIQCTECGKRIVPTSNAMKYCPQCAKIVKKRQHAEWARANREKLKKEKSA